MLDILFNPYLLGVLTWISGISVLFIVFIWFRKRQLKSSITKINKRIDFINNHKTYIKRLEYGILSILNTLAIFSTIFLFEYAYRNEADREVGRHFQFLIATLTYCYCLYRSSNFTDMANAKEVIKKLNKNKKVLEDKIEKRNQ